MNIIISIKGLESYRLFWSLNAEFSRVEFEINARSHLISVLTFVGMIQWRLLKKFDGWSKLSDNV